MAELILSAFADEYSDNFDEQLSALAGFGIRNIELRHADGKNISEMSREDIRGLKRRLDASGIAVSSIGSPLGKISIDGDVDAHIELAKRIFESARTLGTNKVRMFSFYIPEGDDPSGHRCTVLSSLERMVRAAEEYDILLCHENEAKIYGESPERCLDILKYFDGKIKAVFDMGNFVLDGYKPYPDAYNLLYPYIEYFHIKDSLYAGAIVPAGCGEASIKEILDDYKARSDRDTYITLEPHLQTFAGLNALVGKSFDNPYKYVDQRAAFTDAVEKLKGIS